MVEHEPGLDTTREKVEVLKDLLLAHLQYEEDQLLEPIGRLAIGI